MGSYQAAIAFLITKQEGMLMILLKEFDLLTNIFESGQHFNHIHIICFSNCFCHVGRYDRGYQCTVFWQMSQFLTDTQFIFCNEQTGHISGKWHITARL